MISKSKDIYTYRCTSLLMLLAWLKINMGHLLVNVTSTSIDQDNVKSNRCTEMLAWERLIQAMLSVNVILK